jgi:hypothetical protein
MSEAELHVLRARLRGGILNKARRGELDIPLPVGFVADAAGRSVWIRISRSKRHSAPSSRPFGAPDPPPRP